jgi:photosystem II stability/assembly factor-like uncharacterized protein
MRGRSGGLAAAVSVVGVMLLSPQDAAAQANWREHGPAPIRSVLYTGRVSAVVCSPTDPDRYFAAGADAGVWRTIDGGANWDALTEGMPTTSIGALALDPTNESIIYAGTGESNYANHSRYGVGLYKSTDGGDTWTQLAESVFAGRAFSRIVVNPQQPQIVYAAITRAGGFPELAAAKGHPGATGAVGVFRSLDGGVSWAQLTNGLPSLSATDLAIDPANPNVLYAGIGRIFGDAANGIYKSSDGGASWTKLAGGLPTSNVGRIAVAVAPSMPSRLYALVTKAADAFGGSADTLGGFRSDDSGQTWTSVPVGSIQATYGWYLCIVAVDPSNPDRVVMGGLNLLRSENAGASWIFITPPHVDLHAAAWDAAGRLLAADDGGVHRSSTNGGNWESINGRIGAIQFYAGLSAHPTDDLIFFGGTQDNGTLRRNTNSRRWDQVLGGDGGWTQLDQSNPLIVFGEFQGTGNLFRSTDGGGSFNSVASGINPADRNCFLPPYVIDQSNPTRVLYASHRIYRSTNGGVNWSALSGDLTNGAGAIRALAMAPSNTQVIYAATNDGNFLRSDNGGQNFTTLLTNNAGWPRVTREIFVHPNDPMTVYLAGAVFGVPHVRRSTDGGQSWTTLDGNLPDVPVNVLAVDVRGNKPTIYAGSDVGLFRSLNHGASWHRYGLNLPNVPVIDLVLEPGRGRLAAATQGRGAWSTSIAVAADMNGDDVVDAFDIDPFILALVDPNGYAAMFPNLDPIIRGDLTGDNTVDSFDIEPFVQALFP